MASYTAGQVRAAEDIIRSAHGEKRVKQLRARAAKAAKPKPDRAPRLPGLSAAETRELLYSADPRVRESAWRELYGPAAVESERHE